MLITCVRTRQALDLKQTRVRRTGSGLSKPESDVLIRSCYVHHFVEASEYYFRSMLWIMMDFKLDLKTLCRTSINISADPLKLTMILGHINITETGCWIV